MLKRAHNFIDRTGERYGKLKVISLANPNSTVLRWLCECSCGNVLKVLSTNLATYKKRNIGCFECKKPRSKTAHFNNLYTYSSWAAMIQRCTNPNNSRWHRYGGRRITVCKQWESFDSFLNDMGVRPFGYTIGRIDGDGNYEPSNCKWETYQENIRNDYKKGNNNG